MSEKQVKIQINGKKVSTKEGDFLLQVALNNGFDIPYFCYHPDFVVGQYYVCWKKYMKVCLFTEISHPTLF